MAESGKWYVIHTYSGYENKVKTSIEAIIENRHMQDSISEAIIPMEKKTELNKKGEMVEVERKLFPSYVLVNMVMNDDTWMVVRNVRGVTGFVGPDGKPTPLTEEEMASLGVVKSVAQVDYKVGDSVKIISGSLENFTGIVDEIDIPNNKVRVIISMFGRETPAELELDQIALM